MRDLSEVRAILAGHRRPFVELRCGHCGGWLGGVYDSRVGALLYTEHYRTGDAHGGDLEFAPRLRPLERDGTLDPDLLTASCRRHGDIQLDQADLLARVASARRTGRCAKIAPR